MGTVEDHTYQPISRAMRLVLWFVAVNAFAAAISLIIFPRDTSSTFFWTIAPPINAAMFGALYLAAGVSVARAAVQGRWEPARYLAPMIPAFTAAMLLTTLLHFDRLDRGVELYYWIFVYIFAPLAGIFLFVSHERRGSSWSIESRPTARPLRAVAVAAGGATLVYAIVCYGWPELIGRLWPWTITPLMVRVFASWLFAFAAGLLWFGREPDWERMRPVADMLLLTAALLGLMLILHRSDVRWDAPAAMPFSAGIVCIGLLGVSTVWYHRRDRSVSGSMSKSAT